MKKVNIQLILINKIYLNVQLREGVREYEE